MTYPDEPPSELDELPPDPQDYDADLPWRTASQPARVPGPARVPETVRPARMRAVPRVADRAALRAEAETLLQSLVGRSDARLRADQWVAIEALVADRRRALVVERTGWGKSAVYFVATALLRARGSGPTIVISPLLALMRNQIEAARKAGINAVTVNSANLEEWAQVHDAVRRGEADLLLVSPERLNNPGFRDEVLPSLAASAGLVVIDEAHCISDWGHDFRADYRRIRTLLGGLPEGIPVLATTATANQRVVVDVAEQLAGQSGGGLDGVVVLRGSLERESLHLGVVELSDQTARLAWLADHLRELDGSGIIYCLTVAATQQVADHLRSCGYEVAAYSGQTDTAARAAAEQDLLANRVKALVATSALGMGFDKPDLGFVIHLGAPASPIGYYQQVGRAGRAVDKATVLLLPGQEDKEIWAYFGSLGFPRQEQVRLALGTLEASAEPMSTAALETYVDLRRTRLETMLKVLDVDGAVRRVRGGWESTGRPWTYDAERYDRVTATRKAEQQAMLDYISTSECRMRFLREALDDEAAADCGRCDNCGGLHVALDVSDAQVASAEGLLTKPGVPVEPRKMWPTGLGRLSSELGEELKGKIAADQQVGPGRAIARLDGLGWGNALRELLRTGTGDDELPVPLRFPMAEVLRAWPAGSFDGVVYVDSHSRPRLLAHVAGGAAHVLGVPMLGTATPRQPAGSPDVNSATRLRQVATRFSLDLKGPVRGQRLLLIDDRTDSGWTLTVVGRLLRAEGAASVAPFALAIG